MEWKLVENKKYIPKQKSKKSSHINKNFHSNNDNENYNKKKMMCNSMIRNSECVYGSKCLFAHNLNEQNIDDDKKLIYDILDKYIEHVNSNNNAHIYDIDLSDKKNDDMLKLILRHTKLCNNCDNGKCTGGWNCKFGVINKKYIVCYNDVNTGKCETKNCDKIHLTKIGFIPMASTKIKHSSELANDNFFTFKKIMDSVLDSDELDNLSAGSVDKINKYLSEYDSDVDCEKSIFD